MADSFEIMKVWIPLGSKTGKDEYGHNFLPVNNAKTDEAWQNASKLAKDGWDMVGVIPITGYIGQTVMTIGYTLLFKRQIQ